MNNSNLYKDFFESISDYRKIVLTILLIQNDKQSMKEIGFSKHDVNQLKSECKNVIIEGYEEYFDYVKNIEESAFEKFLKR